MRISSFIRTDSSSSAGCCGCAPRGRKARFGSASSRKILSFKSVRLSACSSPLSPRTPAGRFISCPALRKSASTSSTRAFCHAKARASCAATVDLPSPPTGLVTRITCARRPLCRICIAVRSSRNDSLNPALSIAGTGIAVAASALACTSTTPGMASDTAPSLGSQRAGSFSIAARHRGPPPAACGITAINGSPSSFSVSHLP